MYLELLGGHVVSIADEDLVVLAEELVDFLEVGGLPFRSYLSPNHIV